MEKTIYIVTGAAGHLGSTIARLLVRRGAEVRALILKDDPAPALNGLKLTLVHGDVCRPQTLAPLFRNPDGYRLAVIHAAGLISIAAKPSPALFEVNVNGTKNMIALCLRHNVSKLVYVSSVHAIPETEGIIRETSRFSPDTVHGFYAKTKAAATAAVLESTKAGLDASVVHPSGILGPGDYGSAHLTQLVADYLNGRLAACVRGGYDFADVRDIASGIISCVKNGRPGECYILSGHYCTIQELLDTLSRVSGQKKVSLVLPMELARLTAPLAELYYKVLGQPPLYTAYSLYTVRTNADFSRQKSMEELGYRVRSLSETLADTCAWMRAEGRVKK